MSPAQTMAVPRTPRMKTPTPYRASAHRLLWNRIRRFFPPHAEVLQTPAGTLEISWSLTADRGSRYATPVLVRLERAWVADVEAADDWGRNVMAARAAETVRQGMFGYEPEAPLPQARVIIVG